MKRIIQIILAIGLIVSLLAACGGNDDGEALSEDKLVVGVTAGPHEEIFEVIQELAEDEGLEIEIKVFSDYIMPNTSLAEGDLDVNSYQHEPFMKQFNEDHDTNLAAHFDTTLSAIGVYSETLTDIQDTPEGAKIGIANDPTNGARALIMFEEAGLITLDTDDKENASVLDIGENERNLEFVELEAAQIPKQLSELDLGVINGNYAIENGLSPTEDSLLSESEDSPFVNVLVVREENLDDPVLETLKDLYHSKEVAEFILEQYDGVILPSWDY
ncbi:MAG TPA: MetQ/NlpA family ABC transporter substrate-binding protein [Bacillota bacterium]|nr:MetQ/NlpA family ABC transporter substrate-binding protein [Bacillota bacterium]